MSQLLSDYNKNGERASNVAQPLIYSDLNTRLDINPITLDIMPLTDIDAVKNSIKNLCLTEFHERPFDPTKGGGLSGLLFSNASVYSAMELENAILKVISKHEPRVTDVRVSVTDNSDRNEYRISVMFRVFYDTTFQETSFNLVRLR